MKIVVFGANGRIGRLVVRQALAAGHEVTAALRDPAAMDERADRLRLVHGDVRDVASVREAVRGQDAVVSAIGHRERRDVNSIYSVAARNYVEAMSACGVTRLIAVSAFVAESASRTGFVFRSIIRPLLLEAVFADLEAAEAIYRSSALDWTTVRPSRLTTGTRTGKFRVGVDLRGNLFSKISRADVADFIVDQVASDAWTHASPELSY